MEENKKEALSGEQERKQLPRWAVVLLCVLGVSVLLLALAVGWFVDEIWFDNDRRGPDAEDRIEQWADGVENEVEQWVEQIIPVGSQVNYEDSSRYQKGACGFTDPIRRIEIQWISGSVRLEHWDGETVVLEETEPEDSDQLLRWRLVGDTLMVQYCAPGSYANLSEKDLVVKLPKSGVEKIWVNTVSADCTAVDLELRDLEISSTSGGLLVEGVFEELSAETVSGEIDIQGAARELEVDTTSGDTKLALEQTPNELSYDGVSGDLRLTLPGERSFELETETVSGDVRCEFEAQGDGEHRFYSSGTADAPAELDLSTVSGDLEIRKS